MCHQYSTGRLNLGTSHLLFGSWIFRSTRAHFDRSLVQLLLSLLRIYAGRYVSCSLSCDWVVLSAGTLILLIEEFF